MVAMTSAKTPELVLDSLDAPQIPLAETGIPSEPALAQLATKNTVKIESRIDSLTVPLGWKDGDPGVPHYMKDLLRLNRG